VKILFVISVLITLVSQSAWSAGWPASDGLLRVQMQRQRPGGYERQAPRDFRRPEQPPQPAPGQRPNGRLTDDERRDLHRDLDRANREIYKGRP
jgi:hypothetical protein